MLFKTDALVQDVHFTAQTPAEKAGRKALARALSDIAAMAGEPVSCLVTIGLPQGFDPDWLARFYEGLNALAREFNVSVAGGETTSSPGGIFVSVTLLGTIPQERIISRAQAKAGEVLFVKGRTGFVKLR